MPNEATIKKIFKFILALFIFSSISFGKGEESELVDDPLVNYGEAMVFGLVEGVTEFLPISSTGHLILTNEWMLDPSSLNEVEKDAVNAYLIVIQAGAILAVALLYSKRIFAVVLGFLGLDPVGKKLGFNLLAAFAPAVALGPLLDQWIESFFVWNGPCICSFDCWSTAYALGGEKKEKE